jgi:cytochrome P450
MIEARALPDPGMISALRFYPRRSFAPTLSFLEEMARTYGEIAHFRLFFDHFFMIDDADLLRDVLVTRQHDFVKSRGAVVLRRFFGEGLITSEEPLHRTQRRLMQPAFNHDRLTAYGSVMTRRALQASAGWQPGESRDIALEMQRLALGIVGEALFGADVASEGDEVRDAIERIMDLVPKAFGPLGRLTDHLPPVLPSRIESHRVTKRLDAVIGRMIERRRAGPASGDLLSTLVRAHEAGGASPMSDRQLRDEAMTLLLAGNDTTALALTWTWYLLAKHPEVEAQLHAELDTVLGERVATPDDVAHLPYTAKVFTEALRLYPPAWLLGRTAIRRVAIGKYEIASGDTVLFSPYVTHRNPRYYALPYAFRPARWPIADLPKFAYFPFGGGARVCIGEPFALLESVLLLATLARRWRLRLDQDAALTIEPFVTLRPSGPLVMHLEKRQT